MKAKTIKKVLHKKISEWIDSVEDKDVKTAIKQGAIVTGGSIASMYLNEEVNDFDIYFKDIDRLDKVVEYYTSMHGLSYSIKERKKERILYIKEGEDVEFNDFLKIQSEVKEGEYKPLYFTPNAITLSDKVQIVCRFYGEIDEIHKNYDYVHATNAYDYKQNELIIRQEAIESLLTRDLYYIGSKYPLTSVIRAKKFILRGWKISAGEYLKMIIQCSDLDLYDSEVLREQLIGVDIAYFKEVIDAVNNINDKTKLTQEYLFSIINRVFT